MIPPEQATSSRLCAMPYPERVSCHGSRGNTGLGQLPPPLASRGRQGTTSKEFTATQDRAWHLAACVRMLHCSQLQ
jgi:hypothetical protein